MTKIIILSLLFCSCAAAAQDARMLDKAAPYLPVLKSQIAAFWPDHPLPSTFGGLIEKESLWNPRAQLRTSREQGVGFSQLTRAFRSDGSTRFDAMTELRNAYPAELRGLSWDNPFQADLQLRAVVLKNRMSWRQVGSNWESEANRLAATLSAYNGGAGGVLSDQKMCAAVAGCAPGLWFGNVENYSMKSRVKWQGYGQSAFDINRGYVTDILFRRRLKYRAALGG